MEFVKIGTITGTHGLQGAMNISILNDAYEQLIKRDLFLFVELRQRTYIPYQISELKKSASNHFIISLNSFDQVDQTKKINGCDLFVPISDTKSLPLQQLAPEYLSTFIINDEHTSFSGKIDQIIESAGQMLAFVTYQGKEVIIPLHESLIKDIDEENQIITLAIPDGLIDIYLDGN